MEPVAKYARTILNGLEKRPRMYGDALSVELQYLLTLEFLALAEGNDLKEVRQAYKRALVRRFKTSQSPAACRDIPIEEVIDILKPVRDEFDTSRWIDVDVSETE